MSNDQSVDLTFEDEVKFDLEEKKPTKPKELTTKEKANEIKQPKRREVLLNERDKILISKNLVTLKKDVLDPQGKVIHQTLDGMGFDDVNEVRQGKYFEIDTKETDNDKAKAKVEEMCKKLLANLVIENYKIIDPK